jgi:hypothetical protein
MFLTIQYCRQIWLGLYEANHVHDTKDEQQIKDFMVAKYEKKRYVFLDHFLGCIRTYFTCVGYVALNSRMLL